MFLLKREHRAFLAFMCDMKKTSFVLLSSALLALQYLLVACGPTINQIKPPPTAAINKSFQNLLSPLPTVPPYLCGAWTANNSPSAYGYVTLYARLTKNTQGVSGARVLAVVHFASYDMTLDQRPASDSGGYITITFALNGRQPRLIPATITVTFTAGHTTVRCSQAFFTPQ